MKKIDLKNELKNLYNPSKSTVTIIDVPKMNFIMLDGKGDPNTSADYKKAVESLFSVAFALKFISKKGAIGIDYTVMPLEGLWWVGQGETFSLKHKDNWQWTAMIMQPDWITTDMFKQAVDDVNKKKGALAFDKLYYKDFTEGQAAQILYTGSYQEEGPVIQSIHAAIIKHGGKIVGKHHEIYLSDPRKAAPEKLKTIIRQPFIK